ncbi:ubiquitin ligase e3 alpha-related [Anaeramoeba flamelloides]|uniref:E3 ubiquitin-protein ligase n=1 Tax=Anaeramoeba flamelloides TaxID=1746091 RepID=A0ABQ8XXC6_9EUKA|nr:ubiquitin ligase e3 alpha-related [Anaeramoeba flamelloides]
MSFDFIITKEIVGEYFSQKIDEIEPFIDFLFQEPSYKSEILGYLEEILAGSATKTKILSDLLHPSTHSKCCGKVWCNGGISYRCNTCSLNTTATLCPECFKKGNHFGHDFVIFKSKFGCCDCGNSDVFKEQGFCKNSKTQKENEMKLEPDFIKRLIFITNGIIKQILIHLYELANLDSELILQVLDWINILNTQNRDISKYLTKQFLDYSFEEKNFIEHIFYYSMNKKTNQNKKKFFSSLKKLICQSLSNHQFRRSFGGIFLKHYKGITIHNIFHNINFFSGWPIRFFTTGKEMQYFCQKLKIVEIIFETYFSIMNTALIPSFSDGVSILNCQDPIIKNYKLKKILTDIEFLFENQYSNQYIFQTMEKKKNKDSLFLQFLKQGVFYFSGMNTFKRQTELTSRLNHPLDNGNNNNNWVNCYNYESKIYSISYLINGNLKNFSTKTIKQLIYNFIDILIKWIGSNNAINNDMETILVELPNCIEFQSIKKQFEIYSYNIHNNPISFHFPLHRIFSLILAQYLQKTEENFEFFLQNTAIYDQKNNSFSKFLTLVEHLIRLQVLTSEISIGIWNRNDSSIKHQINLQRGPLFSQFCIDKDVFLLQVCASLLDPEHFILDLMESFKIVDYFILDESNEGEGYGDGDNNNKDKNSNKNKNNKNKNKKNKNNDNNNEEINNNKIKKANKKFNNDHKPRLEDNNNNNIDGDGDGDEDNDNDNISNSHINFKYFLSSIHRKLPENENNKKSKTDNQELKTKKEINTIQNNSLTPDKSLIIDNDSEEGIESVSGHESDDLDVIFSYSDNDDDSDLESSDNSDSIEDDYKELENEIFRLKTELVCDFFKLLIIILVERSESGFLTIEEKIIRELVHILAVKDHTHSTLINELPQSLIKNIEMSKLDSIIDKVTEKTHKKDIIYSLKTKYWKHYESFYFPHLSKIEEQIAEDNFRKFIKQLKTQNVEESKQYEIIKPTFDKIRPQLSNISQLLHNHLIHQLLFITLYNSKIKNTLRKSDQLFILSLHLIYLILTVEPDFEFNSQIPIQIEKKNEKKNQKKKHKIIKFESKKKKNHLNNNINIKFDLIGSKSENDNNNDDDDDDNNNKNNYNDQKKNQRKRMLSELNSNFNNLTNPIKYHKKNPKKLEFIQFPTQNNFLINCFHSIETPIGMESFCTLLIYFSVDVKKKEFHSLIKEILELMKKKNPQKKKYLNNLIQSSLKKGQLDKKQEERKKQLILARQRRIMENLKERSKQFSKKYEKELENTQTIIRFDTIMKSFSLFEPDYSHLKYNERQTRFLCAECRNLGSEMEVMSILGYASSTPQGIILTSCGHGLHVSCYQQYFDNLISRRLNERLYEGMFCSNLERGEFLCPVCKQIANTVIPIISNKVINYFQINQDHNSNNSDGGNININIIDDDDDDEEKIIDITDHFDSNDKDENNKDNINVEEEEEPEQEEEEEEEEEEENEEENKNSNKYEDNNNEDNVLNIILDSKIINNLLNTESKIIKFPNEFIIESIQDFINRLSSFSMNIIEENYSFEILLNLLFNSITNLEIATRLDGNEFISSVQHFQLQTLSRICFSFGKTTKNGVKCRNQLKHNFKLFLKNNIPINEEFENILQIDLVKFFIWIYYLIAPNFDKSLFYELLNEIYPIVILQILHTIGITKLNRDNFEKNEKLIIDYTLPFLRSIIIFLEHCIDQEKSTKKVVFECRDFYNICEILHIPSDLNQIFHGKNDGGNGGGVGGNRNKKLIKCFQNWGKKFKTQINHIINPFKPFEFLQLPTTFQELNIWYELRSKQNKFNKINKIYENEMSEQDVNEKEFEFFENKIPKNAAISLISGQLYDLESFQERNQIVLAVSGSFASAVFVYQPDCGLVDLGSFYVDKWGEIDIGLRRGRTLYLDENKIREFYQKFLNNEIIYWTAELRTKKPLLKIRF